MQDDKFEEWESFKFSNNHSRLQREYNQPRGYMNRKEESVENSDFSEPLMSEESHSSISEHENLLQSGVQGIQLQNIMQEIPPVNMSVIRPPLFEPELRTPITSKLNLASFSTIASTYRQNKASNRGGHSNMYRNGARSLTDTSMNFLLPELGYQSHDAFVERGQGRLMPLPTSIQNLASSFRNIH